MWNHTLCHNFCSHFPRKERQKEEGMEKKEKTGEVVNSSFKMLLLHKSLVFTGRPQGLALPRPLRGTVSWCSAPEQGGNTEAGIFQGRGFPIQLMLLLLLPGCLMAHSLPRCELGAVPRPANRREWLQMNLGCWSGHVQQRSSRQECPEEGDASTLTVFRHPNQASCFHLLLNVRIQHPEH